MNLNNLEVFQEDQSGYQELCNALSKTTIKEMTSAEKIVCEMYEPESLSPETESEIYLLFRTYHNKQDSLIDFLAKYSDIVYYEIGEDWSKVLNENIHIQGEILSGREELIVAYKAQKMAEELMTYDIISEEISTICTTIDAINELNINYLPGIKELLQQYVDEQSL